MMRSATWGYLQMPDERRASVRVRSPERVQKGAYAVALVSTRSGQTGMESEAGNKYDKNSI